MCNRIRPTIAQTDILHSKQDSSKRPEMTASDFGHHIMYYINYLIILIYPVLPDL